MKILFITSTRLGDAVLSTGLLDYMHHQFPAGKVSVACGPLPSTIFEGFPNVTRILPMTKEKRHGHWIKLWKQVIGTRWDIVVDLRDSAVSRLIRADKRYILTRGIDKNAHKVVQCAQVMKLDSVPPPKLYFTPAQKNFADDMIGKDPRPVLGIGPSANWIGKTWAVERFIALSDWITSDNGLLPGARICVFAAPGEEDQASPLLTHIPPERQIDMIAKGNPAQAAAVISRCALYVGNDSGLMHCAAASGVPTFGLFGPSYPHIYRPWGAHADFAQTPESFDELIDFPGYHPQTLTHSLMESLKLDTVIQDLQDFWGNKIENNA